MHLHLSVDLDYFWCRDTRDIMTRSKFIALKLYGGCCMLHHFIIDVRLLFSCSPDVFMLIVF